MQQLRLPLALAVGVVLGITAVSSVLWLAGAEHGLPVSELVRVESLEDGDGSALDDHMRWSFQLLTIGGRSPTRT